MAESSHGTRRDGKRYTDVSKEPTKPLPPIEKFSGKCPVGLQDAIKTIERFVNNLPHYALFSFNKCKLPKEGLTQNESAALYLYSLQWPEGQHSFYTLFNRALRNEDRTKLIPYNNYLHLFMTALGKLPSIQDRVWRGVNGDISEQYKPNSVHVWWGASSCSDMVHVTDGFLDKDNYRTLFNIKCYEGKIIKNHSAFPNESEIVLPPGTCLKVKSVSSPAPQLHIIDMEQIPYEEPSSEILSSLASSLVKYHVYLVWLDASVNTSQENIQIRTQLEQLEAEFKGFQKLEECEFFIQQNKTNCRIVLIVSGQFGRQIINKIHDLSQLVAIFVFCGNKVENEKWAKNYKKINAVLISAKDLLQQIKEEIAIQTKALQHDDQATNSASSASPSYDSEVVDKLSPIEGYQKMPLVTLEKAIERVSSLLGDEWKQYVYIAKENYNPCQYGLTIDEFAAITIYSMDWDPQETCIYRILNQALRSEDRNKLKPWFSYLKLILVALDKLPSYEGTVWRSLPFDLKNDYQKGLMMTWWGFSSTVKNTEVSHLSTVIGKDGVRTLFSIQCKHGKDIHNYSYYCMEDEILLMPGFRFVVESQLDAGNGLTIINLKEI